MRAHLVRSPLIATTSTVGLGTGPDDLVRHVYELWTGDGHLVASRDAATQDVAVGHGFDDLFRRNDAP